MLTPGAPSTARAVVEAVYEGMSVCRGIVGLMIYFPSRSDLLPHMLPQARMASSGIQTFCDLS